MGDYSLKRARSLATFPYPTPNTYGLTESKSESNLITYVHSGNDYKPQWSSSRKYRFGWSLDHWHDRYYKFSSLYWPRYYLGCKYYYSDYLPNEYYHFSPTYWQKFSHAYVYPGFYRRKHDPFMYGRYYTPPHSRYYYYWWF